MKLQAPSPRGLPPFLVEMLNNPPKAGSGVHGWLYSVARQLHAHFPTPQIIALLSDATRACGRPVPHGEILGAVKSSMETAWTPRANGAPVAPTPAKSKWPAVNQEQREAVIRDHGGLADLWESSPVRIEDNQRHTEDIVGALFPGNPLLCVGDPLTLPDGKPSQTFDTKPREDWRGDLSCHAFIVPSPMSAVYGRRKSDGKLSKHTLENTGPRRFLVIEFDKGTADDHAAVLFHLATKGPLVLAVHSGNKSLHGWFYCAGEQEDVLNRFMRYAVSLGADKATWTRSQFVRLPDGTRDGDKRQAVYYFNPGAIV